MNWLGKTLTLGIVLLCFVFCGFSVMVFAAHKNWSRAAKEAVAKLQAAERSNANLVREIEEVKNELAKERAYRRFQVAQNTSKVTLAQQDVDRLSTESQTLATQLAESTTQHDLTLAQNKFLTGDNKLLMESKVVVEDSLIRQQEKVVKLNDEHAAQSEVVNNLNEERAKLAMQVTDQKYVMDKFGIDVHSTVDNKEPEVDGVITAVREPLVQISLGSDDGLKPGHRLEVFRGNSYLGRIIIRETSPNAAVGSIVKELQKDTFQRGDRVATKLG